MVQLASHFEDLQRPQCHHPGGQVFTQRSLDACCYHQNARYWEHSPELPPYFPHLPPSLLPVPMKSIVTQLRLKLDLSGSSWIPHIQLCSVSLGQMLSSSLLLTKLTSAALYLISPSAPITPSKVPQSSKFLPWLLLQLSAQLDGCCPLHLAWMDRHGWYGPWSESLSKWQRSQVIESLSCFWFSFLYGTSQS